MRYFILSFVVFLASCATGNIKPELVQTVTEYKRIKIVCDKPPHIKPIDWKEITWVVATEDETGFKVIALSFEDYTQLGVNTQENLRWIRDSKNLSKYYLECINDFNKKADINDADL